MKNLNENYKALLRPDNKDVQQQFEDIVKEVYDPNYYNDLPYLKYFYLSDIQRWKNIKNFFGIWIK